MSDFYIVTHIATTCDDANPSYVTKDSTEIIELSWLILDAVSLDVTYTDSILVRPSSTPITPFCSQLHKITWDQVKHCGTFKDAITKFDKYIQDNLANSDFSFVSFDVGKLRVQLPREARDKGVVLPPYLQHPRVFDLQSEYAKWQTTHPEALSYTSSSLSNIITALEVDVGRSQISSPLSSSSSPPPPNNNSVDNIPTNSTVTSLNSETNGNKEEVIPKSRSQSMVDIYTKLLIQLVKKSLPLSDHQSVLTKPYDSSQDVKLFLAERSKILYLSNLAFDTTQSELESWFTQFGARPIAFWTLKNLETAANGNFNKINKSKGISGFAVFGTHEEATESLSMNGKALNDRVIEVQPSSTRVLDKANDLLTPFPPSKNRPRPGDWTCPSCGFSNFQRRTACFRCSFPAASAVAIQEQIHPNYPGMNRRNNGNGQNSHLANSIMRNQSPNISNDKLGPVPSSVNCSNLLNNQQSYNNSPYHNYNYNYGNNHHNNNSGRGHYGGGNSVPFRAGDWKCTNEACQYHNFAKNICCLKCGVAKPVNLGNNHLNQAKINQLQSVNPSNSMKSMNSINPAAAAIAAATASGQSLNLNSSLMGLQLPLPHGGQNQLHNSLASSHTRQANSNHFSRPINQFQYQQGNLSRSTSNGTPQPTQNGNGSQQASLAQQYYLMQPKAQAQPQPQALIPQTQSGLASNVHTQTMSPSLVSGQIYPQNNTASSGLYNSFGYSPYTSLPFNSNEGIIPTGSIDGNGNNLNSVATQLGTLHLNNN